MPEMKKHRPFARLMHWGMAVLVVGMVAIGFVMIQKGLPRPVQNFLFITHKNLGVLMLVLIVVRMAYRWLRPPALAPVALPPVQRMAAHLSHLGLYLLLLIMPLAGYIRVRAGGFPIEFLDRLDLPTLVPRSKELAAAAKAVHYYGSYALAGLILLHIAAAAYHGLIKRDGVMARMWPPIGK
ncbi:cytochrome b [Epibacterium ulvae]|uniref:cytochrome b n=1 Tax=Epibacterium ulvae TaxID=1156985 RepID=UPI00248F490E|nr:cytochrome b [Epibacterium ulvae]